MSKPSWKGEQTAPSWWILTGTYQRSGVLHLIIQAPHSVLDHGFRTLVLNRTRRGGVLAPGASLTRHGENGGGLCSRWYPDTLAKRLQDIAYHAHQLLFYEGDGVGILDTFADHPGSKFFVDPPYTAAGGKRAGSRLYIVGLIGVVQCQAADIPVANQGADLAPVALQNCCCR